MHLHLELVDMSQAEDFVLLSVALERANDMLRPEGTVGLAGPGSASQRRAMRPEPMPSVAASRSRRAAERVLSLVDEMARYPIEQVAAAPL
jgi:hypothetical protein